MPLKVAYDIAPWTSLPVSSYADLLLTWSQVPGIMPTVAGALFLLVLVCVKTLSGEHVSETGWSRVRALPRPISQVGWSAETTLSKPNRRDMPGQRETEGTGPPIDQAGRVTVWPSWPVDGDPPPAVGHPGRQGRPLQGPAAVLSRAVRRGLG